MTRAEPLTAAQRAILAKLPDAELKKIASVDCGKHPTPTLLAAREELVRRGLLAPPQPAADPGRGGDPAAAASAPVERPAADVVGGAVFRVTEEQFRRLQEMNLTYVLPIMLLVVGGAVLTSRSLKPGPLILTAVLLLAVVTISCVVSYRKQVRQWRSFRLTVAPDALVREQDGFQRLTLTPAALSRIVAVPRQGLIVWGGGPNPVLGIPDTIERYDELKALVGRWRQVEERAHPPWWLTWRWPVGLFIVAGIPLLNMTTHPAVVVPVTALLIVAMAAGFRSVRHSPDIDERTRQAAWGALFGIVYLLLRAFRVLWSG